MNAHRMITRKGLVLHPHLLTRFRIIEFLPIFRLCYTVSAVNHSWKREIAPDLDEFC